MKGTTFFLVGLLAAILLLLGEYQLIMVHFTKEKQK
jgi:hypothetical protein